MAFDSTTKEVAFKSCYLFILNFLVTKNEWLKLLVCPFFLWWECTEFKFRLKWVTQILRESKLPVQSMLHLMVLYISCKTLTFAVGSTNTECTVEERRDSSNICPKRCTEENDIPAPKN